MNEEKKDIVKIGSYFLTPSLGFGEEIKFNLKKSTLMISFVSTISLWLFFFGLFHIS